MWTRFYIEELLILQNIFYYYYSEKNETFFFVAVGKRQLFLYWENEPGSAFIIEKKGKQKETIIFFLYWEKHLPFPILNDCVSLLWHPQCFYIEKNVPGSAFHNTVSTTRVHGPSSPAELNRPVNSWHSSDEPGRLTLSEGWTLSLAVPSRCQFKVL